MSFFVDTSAFYALLVRSEGGHKSMLKEYRRALGGSRTLVTSSYVLIETTALLQYRIGLAPVRDFESHFLPLVDVVWVDEALHRRGMSRLTREGRRALSLVDCVSFELMRAKGINQALTLDRHFAEAGFEPRPAARPAGS